MAANRDVVIIGAGHNGLVTAFSLAKAGLKPLVLERRPVAGGAAITEEFHPGFKCPTLAHTGGPLRSEIAAAMQLERHGLEMISPDIRTAALSDDGRALLLYSDVAKCEAEISKFSKKDGAKFADFHRTLSRLADALNPLLDETPPSIDDPSKSELWGLFQTGRRIRGLGEKDMYRLLRWTPMAIADLVAEWFENELLRSVVAARGIFGAFLGPWSAGSSANLLLRSTSDAHPAGGAAFPKGGMGALTQAMAKAAVEAGAEIKTGAEVSAITIRNGEAVGVALASGKEITAKAVISNADPRRTFFNLVGPVHLDPNFVVKLGNYRSMGCVAKVNLALDGMPEFTALKGSSNGALAGRIHIGPTIDYLEHAFDDAKYGAISRAPVLEATIPSLSDPSLAPAGKHVMSVYAQFAPYKLKSGDWNAQREELGKIVVNTLAAYAPNLPGQILHGEIITPLDLEQEYGLTGGHIFHGETSLDQLFTMRPLLGWARYRTPIPGLYLCGTGTHPGFGLSGASGRNAAREVLKDWKAQSRG